jgi:4-amino-4-deoxy-L-arabinose transferase-like glycosyltransferase
VTAAASPAVTAEPRIRSWLGQPARRTYLALGAILVVAAAIRFWDLAGPSFWLDELYSLHFARLPHSQLWSEWMVREPVPPLFYSLLRAWVGVFGEGEFAVRTLSAFFGVLAVGGLFLLARALFSANVALLAAALAAVSSQQLEFSQQVRGYALGLLAAALALYAVVRLTDHWLAGGPVRQSWRDLLLYVGACAVAFYTHTTFFLLPLLANLYMGWVWAFRTPRRRDAALAWIGANLVLTVLCLWWVWITYLQMQAGAEMISWIEKPDAKLGALKLAHIIAPRRFEDAKFLIVPLFGGLFLWGAWRLPMERRVLALLFGAGVPLILFAISQRQAIYMERTLFWVQAIYLPCIAGGILMLPAARLRAPVAAAACLLFLADAISWRATEYREPWREVAAIIAKRAGPNDAVLTYSRDASVNLS